MLTKIPFQKNKIAGRLLMLPVLLMLAGLFAFKSTWHHLSLSDRLKKVRIVLDPGHGANNQGASYNGVKEEELNLVLAKKIREVAKSYDVDIILTREGDNTPEPEQTLKSSLEYRAKFAAEQHADAFISIHMNSNDASGPVKTSGFEIYVSNKKKGNELYLQSLKLGSSINASIAKDYKTYSDLKERDQGVYVLDNAKIPAVLLECGAMDVKADMEFISLPANQEKIARDIIEGVIRFKSAGTSYSGQKADLNTSSMNADADSIPALKKVEVESYYPGGRQAWQNYLQKNLHYPDSAVNHEIQGTVLVEFIVMADGSIDPKDIKVKKGPAGLREESIRVIRDSGKWIPAQDHGVAVNAYRLQPISYKLEVQEQKK